MHLLQQYSGYLLIGYLSIKYALQSGGKHQSVVHIIYCS
ncbi:MAG: hypothetical protein OFPI_02830 [Osedax symbiont Rs2]|nr:MAG: hypothetical protein OFPI_02830 [Osedax symbiont Rs2]